MQDRSIHPDPVPRPLDHLALLGARDAPALVDGHGVLDHRGLDRAVGAAAAGLRARGLRDGDRVASWLAKTRLACVLPLACARAGLVHVPINPLLKRAQVAHILADSGSVLLVTGEARAGTLAAGDTADAALLIEEEGGAALLGDAEPLPASAAAPATLAALLYTSGSTGSPKGVMLSHANLWLGAISVASYLRLAPDDRTLCVLPLSFDYGQNQLLSTWAAGGCAVPLDHLVAADVVRAIDAHRITTLAGVPPLWLQLADARWPEGTAASLRRITSSGGRLPVPLVRRLRATFPQADLYSMYGLTEAFRSTFLDPALVDRHPDSIGRAIPFAEVSVRRVDGSEAADGEVGELVHAGLLVAQGYWRDPAGSAASFRPTPGGTAVWSGDRVRRDADGLLYFVAREDEMIKTSGNRLSPQEIEDATLASTVAGEAVAIGVADAALGQAILLIAEPAEGAADPEAVLRRHLRRTLPTYMQPRTIVWLDRLPRNANGKIDRAALRAEYGR